MAKKTKITPQNSSDLLLNYKNLDFENVDYGSLSPEMQALFKMRDATNGDVDATYSFAQTLLEMALAEKNYDRSRAVNQSAEMQAAGMSRASSLAALSGGSQSQLAITPQGTDVAGHDIQRKQFIADTVFKASELAIQVASLPYDLRVKQSTADLMNSQNTMLTEQRNGQLLATAAIQSCSNLGFDFEGQNAQSIMQYMRGVPDLAPLVQDISRNPYAFASLSQLASQDYATRAQSFEPKYAEYRARQERALAALAENDEDNIDYNNTLLANEVFRDNVATALYQAVEYAKANAGIKQSEVDAAKLDNIIQHIKEFNQTDLEILRLQYDEARMMRDPELRKSMLESLTNSARFQASQAMYGYSLTNEFQKVYTAENTFNRDELVKNVKKYFYGVDLGGYQSSNNIRGWITSGGTAIGAVSACLLAGYKLFGPKVITPPMYQGWTPNFTAPTQSWTY